MKTRQSQTNRGRGGLISKIIPYVLVFGAILAVMVVGSQKDIQTSQSSAMMKAIYNDDFTLTADQLSESYIVADLANTFTLPALFSISDNYSFVAAKYAMASTIDNGVIEKPNIIDTSSLSRGIKSYIVVEGDTLAAIAARYGVDENLIRWSNNMKNATLSVGQRLYIPSVPGILYTVKEGETLAGLAEKYKSDATQIITYNDLETSGLVAGMTIMLPGGELPEKERPEYVAPVARPRTYSLLVRDSGTRYDSRIIGFPSAVYPGNPNYGGQCTWFAWNWRMTDGRSLGKMPLNPSGGGAVIGNAGQWASRLAGMGYGIGRNPAVGAIVQTSTGSPGHVGVVVGMAPGEYIVIQEMNYMGMSYRVLESKISWAHALNYNYIY